MASSHGIPRSAALALLGLPADASPRDITRAYRRLAKATHPDRLSAPAAAPTADPTAFALLADAYHALASAPEASLPETSRPGGTPAPRPGRTPAPRPSVPGPVSVAVRVRRPRGEPPERPPIVAGPVRITPSRPPASAPREST